MVNAWSLLLFVLTSGVATAQKDSVPLLNQKVLTFEEAHLGKRVDTGECWDLAAAALNEAGATWDGKYRFGRMIDPTKEAVLPGDIIQFEGVETRVRTAMSETRESMGHHTAIIQNVHTDGTYTLSHQNFGAAGKKVARTKWDRASVIRGRYTIFRPVP